MMEALARRQGETFRGGSSNDNGMIYSFCNSPLYLSIRRWYYR